MGQPLIFALLPRHRRRTSADLWSGWSSASDPLHAV